MMYQVLFSLKNNEKVFMNVAAAVVISALRVKYWGTLNIFRMSHVKNTFTYMSCEYS